MIKKLMEKLNINKEMNDELTSEKIIEMENTFGAHK